MPEIGGRGQRALMEARVLVIGAGGLGAPALIYLAASGLGTLGVIDADRVDLSNLQRQILYDMQDCGQAKVTGAARRIAGINPECRVVPIEASFCPDNGDMVGQYDLVIDGSDNFPTRYLAADRCREHGVPLVSAALLRFEAQISLFKPYLAGDYPCYRCLFPALSGEGDDDIPSCAAAGVLGPLCGLAGSMQAIEAIKEITGIGDSLSGRLVMIDALSCRFREIRVHRDASCGCGLSGPACRDG